MCKINFNIWDLIPRKPITLVADIRKELTEGLGMKGKSLYNRTAGITKTSIAETIFVYKVLCKYGVEIPYEMDRQVKNAITDFFGYDKH